MQNVSGQYVHFFEDFPLLVKCYDANEYIFGFAIIAVCLILNLCIQYFGM